MQGNASAALHKTQVWTRHRPTDVRQREALLYDAGTGGAERVEEKNTNIRCEWIEQIRDYSCKDEREETEKQIILELASREGPRLLTRECAYAHMTASSIILCPDRSKTLMVFHKIYRSWSWTGGHCDGDPDFEAVARREAMEETGVKALRLIRPGIASVEILPVWAHVKRGHAVGSHLHLNVSYLFEAGMDEELRTAPDENSGVRWIDAEQIGQYCTEPDMIPVYLKLIDRANNW